MGHIYTITNRINAAEYIGSSAIEVGSRWARHKTALRAGTHHSRFLQRAWDKYGEQAFSFSVLEMVDDNTMLLDREQHYLDLRKKCFPSSMNYNMCWTAGSCRGRKLTVEQRARLSKAHLGYTRTHESINKQRDTWCQKYGGNYAFRSPNGVIIDGITNLRAFARLQRLDSSCLRLLLEGNIHQHHGWTHPDRPMTPFRFNDPDGNLVEGIMFLKPFCIARGLGYKKMSAVHTGKLRSYRGWSKAK